VRRLLKSPWLKWFALGATLALSFCAVWDWQGRYYATQRWYFWIGPDGCLLHHGWHWPGSGLREWKPDLHNALVIPFGPVAAGLFVLTVFLCWRDWRHPVLNWLRQTRYPLGHCQECGYDLTGNVSGICSECGVPIPETLHAPRTRMILAIMFLLIVIIAMFLLVNALFFPSLAR